LSSEYFCEGKDTRKVFLRFLSLLSWRDARFASFSWGKLLRKDEGEDGFPSPLLRGHAPAFAVVNFRRKDEGVDWESGVGARFQRVKFLLE